MAVFNNDPVFKKQKQTTNMVESEISLRIQINTRSSLENGCWEYPELNSLANVYTIGMEGAELPSEQQNPGPPRSALGEALLRGKRGRVGGGGWPSLDFAPQVDSCYSQYHPSCSQGRSLLLPFNALSWNFNNSNKKQLYKYLRRTKRREHEQEPPS